MSSFSTSAGGAAAVGDTTASVLWLECGGCDGCTMSVLGATGPRLEELLGGGMTRTRIELVHPALALEAGWAFVANLQRARDGELDPFVLVVEGSLFDERCAGDGYFSALGTRDGEPVTVTQWVADLAPRAAAVVAIGTCATWGGIPAAAGNVTGAMGLSDFLPPHFRSRAGLPVVNIPGCAPSGDAFVEALSYVVLHLEGLVPLDLDELGRPRWLYATPTPLVSQRSPEGQSHQADVAADCPVPSRGWINRLGGCAALGGACNGCTRRDFPDSTLPLVVSEPG